MKRLLISIVLASTMFSVGAMTQSAKFAASWDTDPVVAPAYSECADSVCDPKEENTKADVEMATLHVGSKKSILVGVSSEIGIWMLT